MDRSPNQEIPFTEGQGQSQGDGLNPMQRALMERYQNDPQFREQADRTFYASQAGVPAGQRYQESQQAQPQESELDKAERRMNEIDGRIRELENVHRTYNRDATQEELNELTRLDNEKFQLERRLMNLTRQALNDDRQQMQQQQYNGRLEQAKRQRFDEHVRPKIESAHLSVADKNKFYQKALELFQNNPMYGDIQTIPQCDALLSSVMYALIAEHRFPNQRQQAGRHGEELNDQEAQEHKPSGPWSHLPENERKAMEALYPHRTQAAN